MAATTDIAMAMLVLRLRASRKKARAAATEEVASLLRDFEGRAAAGGPLSDIAGTAWVTVSSQLDEPEVASRLIHLGYSESVHIVAPSADDPKNAFRWRGQEVELRCLCEESDEELRELAPDHRSFLLECGDGIVRRIQGYRGGQGVLEHRALPVVDARLLVNLCGAPSPGIALLDPFAGAGGIVIAARECGWTPMSADVDPTVRFGLAELADEHYVSDARELPIPDGTVDAVATEPPYHPSALQAVVGSVQEIARVLRPGARAAFLAGIDQRAPLRAAADRAGLDLVLDTPINRKGTDVTALVLQR